MSIERIKARLPDWARDLKLNLAAIGASEHLSPRLAWGTALAAAVAARNADLVAAIAADAAPHLDDAGARAARAAAAIMGMNNVYYRFLHFTEERGDYAKLPARLRMQVIGNPGVPKLDFELWCLAASAIIGCAHCVRAHEQVVRDGGMTPAIVQDAVRIAAIVHGVAVALDAEPRYPITEEEPHVPDAQPVA
jgi:alkyl hydroperoxide reductase subunit D